MTTNLGTTRRRTRDEVAAALVRQVNSVEQKMTLLQRAAHAAAAAHDVEEASHWLRQTAVAQRLLVDAAIDVSDELEALERLYPAAHGEGPRDGYERRCACGRLVIRCGARTQLLDGFLQWVDERGKLRDVTDAGSEAIPAGQR